jgi:hypothetical protein
MNSQEESIFYSPSQELHGKLVDIIDENFEAYPAAYFNYEQALKELKQLIEARERAAVTSFCKDIQHRVELRFQLARPNEIILPWESTVRPIIYREAQRPEESEPVNYNHHLKPFEKRK